MTTTKDFQPITLNDFKRNSHLIDYVDDNIIVMDNADRTFSPQGTYRLGCYLIIFCLEGEKRININGKPFLLKAEHCAIMLPNAIIRRIDQPSKCNMRIIAISESFLKDITDTSEEVWNIGLYLYHNPIFPIKRETSYRFYLYKELVLESIKTAPRPFLKKAKKHLFSAIFCELLSKLYCDIPPSNDIIDHRQSRSFHIFQEFMKKVSEDDGSHRTVAYYADQLCYSPKHLSTTIKKVCDKNPLTIINEHAIKCIKYQLRHSSMTMKEIADYFDFVSPSFFGKFVKQHTGMSPLQYRNSGEE